MLVPNDTLRNLAMNMSLALYNAGNKNAVVIGKVSTAGPRINGEHNTKNEESDYRWSLRSVYWNGIELFRTREKGHISDEKIQNAIEKEQKKQRL